MQIHPTGWQCQGAKQCQAQPHNHPSPLLATRWAGLKHCLLHTFNIIYIPAGVTLVSPARGPNNKQIDSGEVTCYDLISAAPRLVEIHARSSLLLL